jgi:diaminohydroxyphosphoribosylaminopyrimidine deaminase / 5-amino-6-(5-phosphoribosylamino)uracil reductase
MSMAIALVEPQLGRTGANPAVGCVIVKDGVVVATGVTGDGGRPHGEEAALIAAIDQSLQGATVYVTLEPCAHVSERGPSCADGLCRSGISRVVACLQDPDPRTGGKGFERLRAAGIRVEVGLFEEEARFLVKDFAARFVRT